MRQSGVGGWISPLALRKMAVGEADYNSRDAPGLWTTAPVVPRATGRGRGHVSTL